MSTKAICGLLASLKLCSITKKANFLIPYCANLHSTLDLLRSESFLTYTIVDTNLNCFDLKRVHPNSIKLYFKVSILYSLLGRVKLVGISRVSSPGKSLDIDSLNLMKSKDTYGLSLVSTSRGLMTNLQAIEFQQGGRVLFRLV